MRSQQNRQQALIQSEAKVEDRNDPGRGYRELDDE